MERDVAVFRAAALGVEVFSRHGRVRGSRKWVGVAGGGRNRLGPRWGFSRHLRLRILHFNDSLIDGEPPSIFPGVQLNLCSELRMAPLR